MTSVSPLSAVQVETLQQVQERQAALKICGRTDQALEVAKDYVLNRSHVVDAPFLEHDVSRDGYKAVRREGNNLRLALQAICALTSPVGMAPIEGEARTSSFAKTDLDVPPNVTRGGGAGRAGGCAVVSMTTPEDLVVAQLMRDELETTVEATTGPRGLAVLHTMLDELTIDEAAELLGVTTSTIELYRSRVRQVARDVLRAA